MRFRRSVLQALIALLALSLLAAACSDSDDDSDADPASTASEPTPSTDEAPAETEAPEAPTDTEAPEDTEAADEDASIFPLTITDVTGQEFTFDEPPILGSAGSALAMFADLGVPPAAGWSGPFNEGVLYAGGVPEVMLDDGFDVEQWAQTDVDLILLGAQSAGAPQWQPVVDTYDVFYLNENNAGIQGNRQDLQLLATLLGDPSLADEPIGRFDQLVELMESVAPAEAITVVPMIYVEGYNVVGEDSPLCVLLAQTGLASCPVEGPFATLNPEGLLSIDPDVIYLFGPPGVPPADRDADPVWSQLSAVQNGRVYGPFSSTSWTGVSYRNLYEPVQVILATEFPESGVEMPTAFDFDYDPADFPFPG